MTENNWNLLNGLSLAYMGDAIYEVAIRRHLLEKGLTKPNRLHKVATHYVSAKAHAQLMEKMREESILTEKEVEMYKRGRNANSYTKAKHASVGQYRQSTGFEALMGYLYLTEQQMRLAELIEWCIEKVEEDEHAPQF